MNSARKLLLVVISLSLHYANTCLPATADIPSFDSACGARAVAVVLRRFGSPADVASLADELGTYERRQGCSLYDIGRAFKARGFNCHTVYLPVSAIPQLEGPAILHLNANDDRSPGHFIVAYAGSTGSNTFTVTDGLAAARTIDASQDYMEFSGAALVFDERDINGPGLVKIARRSFERYWWGLTVANAGVAVLALRRRTRPGPGGHFFRRNALL